MANKTKKEATVRGSVRGKRYSGRGRPRSGTEKKVKVKKGEEAPEEDKGPQSNGGQKVPREKEVPANEPVVKRLKAVEPFHLSEQQRALIQEDDLNRKLWEEAMNYLLEGPNFLKKVEQLFMCVCCQELAFQPVTTVCLHNVCKTCLLRSFRAEVYTCPACRHDLGKDYVLILNKTLQALLDQFFPGYSKGR